MTKNNILLVFFVQIIPHFQYAHHHFCRHCNITTPITIPWKKYLYHGDYILLFP